MNPVVSIIIIILMGMMMYRNITIMKRYKSNKNYSICYQKMLRDDEDAYENILNYLDLETKEELINKTRVLKLLYDIEKEDNLEELNKLDLNDLYYTNAKYDKVKANYNIEVYIWLFCLLAKAHKLKKDEFKEILFNKIKQHEDILNNTVEYNILKNAYEIFNGNNDVTFLDNLLKGEYSQYSYDKQLIGVSKRIAEALISYSEKELGEFEQDDLKDFSKSNFGKYVLNCLGIYEKYKEAEVEKEEE